MKIATAQLHNWKPGLVCLLNDNKPKETLILSKNLQCN